MSVNLFGYIQVYNQQIEHMFTQLLQVYLSCHILQMALTPSLSAVNTYRDPGLLEVETECERLPHEHVGVVTGKERSLQLLQLPTVEVRPGAPPLAGQVVIAAQLTVCNKPPISICRSIISTSGPTKLGYVLKGVRV